MKKLAALTLFALVALVGAPLAAAEAPATPAVISEAQPAVIATPAQTAAPAADQLFLSPVAPINLSCSGLCFTEYNSCKLDCRFQPYPGCANDCWLTYQACLAGC